MVTTSDSDVTVYGHVFEYASTSLQQNEKLNQYRVAKTRLSTHEKLIFFKWKHLFKVRLCNFY